MGEMGGNVVDTDTQAIRVAAHERMDFERLWPGQKEAIEAVLAGRDTLAVLATGSGKSAIYQLAAELLHGQAIIVSPLIALQQDQVRMIADLDVGDAAEINSTLGAAERRRRLEQFREGAIRFLFLAPEQLLNEQTQGALRDADVALFVVDEAHCISDWGHDFRPAYVRLGSLVDELGNPVVLGLTATAAPPVRREIIERLHMRDPAVVVRGFDRPAIHLAVQRFHDEDRRRQELLDAVTSTQPPGILYVATRRDAESYASAIDDRGLAAAHYHGGTPDDERRRVHHAFIADQLDVVVATPAFGMGIDKPNVRFVFHAHGPASLDSYYQEIGRAGRDGERATAILFHCDDDLGLRRFLNAGGVEEEHLVAVADALRHGPSDTDLAELEDRSGLSHHKLTIAVARLEDHDVVRLTADGHVCLTGDASDLRGAADLAGDDVDVREHYLESRLEMVRAYTETDQCRGRYLANYYGEQLGDVCGHCDNCDTSTDANEIPRSVPFSIDTRVRHPKWGSGTVVRYAQDRLTVMFDDVGYRTLSLAVVEDRDLLEET